MNFDDYENKDMNTGFDPENGGGDPEKIESPVGKNEAEAANQAPSGDDTGRDQTPEPVQTYDPDDGQQSMWSDPAYESASKDSGDIYTPGRYAYGAQNSHESSREEPKKPKKRHGFLRAACLVLVCALAAGAASYGVVDYMLENNEPASSGTQVILGSSGGNNVTGSTSTSTHKGDTLTANDIYNMATEQVVGVNTSLTTTNIFGQTSNSAVSGSGFIISSDGYILTNYHVVSYAVKYGGDLTVLMHDGTSYEAEVIGYVEDNDVAVIKIAATGLNAVTLGDSDAMQVGDVVYAVGNPLGELDYTLTDGIVSALDRIITTTDETTGASTSMNMFQTNAAVNSGNSGGPVYNAYGEVIGIVTAKYSETGVEGLSFAIPINDAVSLATQLIEHGYVSGAVLGVSVQDASSVYSSFTMQYYGYPDGVCVMEVNSGSAAEKAGVTVGDIITAVGSTKVTSTDELKLALRHYNPGDTESLTVYRVSQTLGSGEYIDLTITFDEKSAETSGENSSSQENTQQNSGGFGGFGNFGGFGG
ncbi:MAG: S1C family serine protease [Oscillospiraceae bacterium]